MVLKTVWSTPSSKLIHKNVQFFQRHFHTRSQSCIPFGTIRMIKEWHKNSFTLPYCCVWHVACLSSEQNNGMIHHVYELHQYTAALTVCQDWCYQWLHSCLQSVLLLKLICIFANSLTYLCLHDDILLEQDMWMQKRSSQSQDIQQEPQPVIRIYSIQMYRSKIQPAVKLVHCKILNTDSHIVY